MFGIVVIAMLAAMPLAQSAPPSTAQTVEAAARLLDDRLAGCGQGAEGLAAWPPGEHLSLDLKTFFAQAVDDRLAGEQQRNQRQIVTGALLPLGLVVDASPREGAGVLEIAGLGEALPPQTPVDTRLYTGAAWRGVISVHQGGRCLAAWPFGTRLRPPDSLVTEVFDDPSAAPYLEASEGPLIEQVLTLAERLRGTVGLSRIASSDAEWRLRVGAVRRISDQAILIGLARAAKAPWVRAAAVERLTDQVKLDEIAQSDKDADVRKAALDRIAELARR